MLLGYALVLLFFIFQFSSGCLRVHDDTPLPGEPDAPDTSYQFQGFFHKDKIVKQQEFHDGVMRYHINGLYGEDSAKEVRMNIIRVDLANPEVFAEVLVGSQVISEGNNQYFKVSRPTHMLKDNNALITINGGFFDMTHSPIGVTMRNGQILREQWDGYAMGFTKGRAFIGRPKGDLHMISENKQYTINGVNSSVFRENSTVLYRYPWYKSPGVSPSFGDDTSYDGENVTELVLTITKEKTARDSSGLSELTGNVIEVRHNQGPYYLDEDTFALTATGVNADKLGEFYIGQEVTVKWNLFIDQFDTNSHEMTNMIGSPTLLVNRGIPISRTTSVWTSRHPRTAVGISQDGRIMTIVVVDGRDGPVEGLSLNTLAQFFAHMGVYKAINLDGGGSSAIAANIHGKVEILNNPSDGSERWVPNGIGIFVK